MTTLEYFDKIIADCRALFIKKNDDYGDAWRIMRTSSLTDQIFIKLARVRSIQQLGEAKINEPIEGEFIGIINYSIMALIQLRVGVVEPQSYVKTENTNILLKQYDSEVAEVRALLEKKNHDYGEIWREMRISSITDIMISKILRIKQIEDNSGKTIVSEGEAANFQDIFNYAIFVLIKMTESKEVININE